MFQKLKNGKAPKPTETPKIETTKEKIALSAYFLGIVEITKTEIIRNKMSICALWVIFFPFQEWRFHFFAFVSWEANTRQAYARRICLCLAYVGAAVKNSFVKFS